MDVCHSASVRIWVELGVWRCDVCVPSLVVGRGKKLWGVGGWWVEGGGLRLGPRCLEGEE